ncbi:MAG TPA: hypothetical protein DCY20_00770 [Firmicutes bacterium]|nr:hypothetical protein [Bacillota bacterium]
MKYYRIIGFAVASALSIGGFAMLTSANEIELNRDFNIQTLSGDASVLNGVGLEATIKTGQSSFETVLLTNGEVIFKDTKYDMYRYVGEDVLENREVYREMYYPAVVENDEYLMAAEIVSGFPYATDKPIVQLNILDKNNGEVVKYESLIDVTTAEYIYYEDLHEFNGEYYYATISQNMRGNQSKLLVYVINPKTGEFNKHYEMEGSSIYELKMVNGNLVTKQYTDQEGDKLIVLNLKTMEIKEVNVSEEAGIEYIGQFYTSNDELYIETNDMLYPVDLENVQFLPHIGGRPEALMAEDCWGWITDFLVQDDNVYMLYDVSGDTIASYQLLQVCDKTTGEIIYQGKLVQRGDQGVVDGFQLVEVK